MFGAVANKQNKVGRVADMVCQVMANTPGLGHTGCANDNGRVAQLIQLALQRAFGVGIGGGGVRAEQARALDADTFEVLRLDDLIDHAE